MGNPKIPIDLLVEKGNKHLTKSEIEERKNTEIKADADKIFAPAFLKTKKQKERFDYLSTELQKVKIIANLDVELLGRHVLLEEQYYLIQKEISKADILSDDYYKLLIKQSKIFTMLDKTTTQLGLNIDVI
jgi:hypothetical protein